MHISNDSADEDPGWSGLIRLQSEYQARMTEETLRYLRSLQSAFSPRQPGTVVRSSGERLSGTGRPGGTVTFDVTIDNRQRVHTPVTPAVTPLVGDGGTTWYPAATLEPVATLLAPDSARDLSVALPLPDDLPADTYRGSLILHGFRPEGVPIEITVTDKPRRRTGATRKAAGR